MAMNFLSLKCYNSSWCAFLNVWYEWMGQIILQHAKLRYIRPFLGCRLCWNVWHSAVIGALVCANFCRVLFPHDWEYRYVAVGLCRQLCIMAGGNEFKQAGAWDFVMLRCSFMCVHALCIFAVCIMHVSLHLYTPSISNNKACNLEPVMLPRLCSYVLLNVCRRWSRQ